jgi:cytosine/adenosine deaminase-related metal-dependent hydrolase
LLGWALSRANLATGEVVDVVVENDRVVAVGRGAADGRLDVADARGKLLLPAFIDTQIHLDKVPITLGTANATLKIGNFELAGIEPSSPPF